LARLSELAKRKVQIETELDSLEKNDPAALAKRGMGKKETMQILGVTANFDCKYCLYGVIGR
jgi:hypothetical protein